MMMYRTAICILVMAILPAQADDVHVSETRSFGYFLGDTVTRTAEIPAAEDEKINPGSLPVPGQVNHWLEIRHVETAAKSTGSRLLQTLTIEYQIFYAALDARPLSIPGIKLRLSKGKEERTVEIPAMAITVSPLRPIEQASDANALRPDELAGKIPSTRYKNLMVVCGTLAAASLALLAYHMAWWPFGQRYGRVFSRAASEIGDWAQSGADRERYAQALMILHRALDQRAGRRLLPDDLAEFIDRHPSHRPVADELAAFFHASRDEFFGVKQEANHTDWTAERLHALARQLAAQERAA